MVRHFKRNLTGLPTNLPARVPIKTLRAHFDRHISAEVLSSFEDRNYAVSRTFDNYNLTYRSVNYSLLYAKM